MTEAAVSDPSPPTPQALRAALSGFATGVTIVTCSDAKGEPVGLTVNSFNALSLEPPLVLWSLRNASPNLAAFAAARHFAINVLAEPQVDLSRRFAAADANANKFDRGAWGQGRCSVPLLAGSAAAFECETVSSQVAGDHTLFIGRVLWATGNTAAPLVFHGGRYHMLGEIL